MDTKLVFNFHIAQKYRSNIVIYWKYDYYIL